MGTVRRIEVPRRVIVTDEPTPTPEDELRDQAKTEIETPPEPVPDAATLPEDVPDGHVDDDGSPETHEGDPE
jgi:hypothetical protein